MTVIGFDAKRAVRNATGLGNYSRTLINNLILQNKGEYEFLLYAPDEGKEELRSRLNIPNENLRLAPCPIKSSLCQGLWRSKGVVKDLVRDKVNIYHGLSAELPKGLKKADIKGVVTIHDLIFMRHPEYYHWLEPWTYKRKFYAALKEADMIIAISECTKRDIIEFGDVPAEKIKVVYQGCDDSFKVKVSEERKEEVRKTYNLPERFILSIGTIEERKNALLAVKALKMLPEDVSLVLVGRSTAYTKQILKYAKTNGLTGRLHILNQLPLSCLSGLYQMAEVFVYPSRYEGFGIPIIEAIHSGLPVVAATGSCLEEAGGPDSLYVDPDDEKGCAEAIKSRLLNSENEEKRQMAINNSLEYVKRFSETSVAKEVMEIYNELEKI